MRQYEAEALLTALVAAFPFPTPPEATLTYYRQQFMGLSDVEAATTAVRGLCGSARRLPPWADIHEAYREAVERKAEERARHRGIEEPEVVPGREHALAVLAAFDRVPAEEVGGLTPLTTLMRAYFERIAQGNDRKETT
jgi:hypothetical protein